MITPAVCIRPSIISQKTPAPSASSVLMAMNGPATGTSSGANRSLSLSSPISTVVAITSEIRYPVPKTVVPPMARPRSARVCSR